jgi:lipopolysaccharide/colanic/teichoic acid biosynthesis glycosyltransferase
MSYEDQTRVIDAITDIASMYRLAPEPLYGASGDRLGRQLHPELANHLAAPGSSTEAPLDEGSELSASFFPNPAQEESRDGWYEVSGKRVLDLIGALVGLLAALPVLAVCAVAVRLGSPGPLIFRQRRIGQSGRPFELLKFRTMIGGSEGPRITAAGDERVTGAGRWLRRWKLDELPQLINVLRGEMALVGPRPELAEYVATYTSEQRSVLKVKPGITSPASLIYVHEEEILARYPNPEEFYARVLLPHKLRIDQAYCRTASLGLDLRILGATVRRLLPRRGTNRANAAAFPSIASKPQV